MKDHMKRIEIRRCNSGVSLKQDMLDLGLVVGDVEILDVYLFYGDITDEEMSRIVQIVADPVSDEYGEFDFPQNAKVIEIALNPGVMDPVAIDTLEVARRMGVKIEGVRTLKKYVFYEAGDETINLTKERILFNPLIQHVVIEEEELFHHIKLKEITPTVNLSSMSSEKLLGLSKSMGLFLNKEEMLKISNYFSDEGRDPTVTELETFGILWSEHCSHKTMRGDIKIKNQKSKIKNLLKSTVMKVTDELKKPWIISAFKDNAGIIEFDDKYALCFKVETHNHPSALEPFGGAATGVGGVIRDILGCGLGAKPIANTDVFCVGYPDELYSSLPKGVLHPRRILRGIVAGVADYGNKMGIPTVNGSVTFHRGYTTNPLVYCGCIGILPKTACQKRVNPGDLVILVGGRTGRDGIHGATFSSGVMNETTQKEFGSAVQIGDPIREKNLHDALLIARDKGLYNSITDCGAGGICTAVSELANGIGAEVQLENVPLKYTGLTPTEIWVSESQERMILAAPENNLEELESVFERYESELTVIGRFVISKRVKVKYKELIICDVDLDFLLHGMPETAKMAILPPSKRNRGKAKKAHITIDEGIDTILEGMLSEPDIASKEWIVRQYDHEVQGATVIKPLYADAAVLNPLFLKGKRGVAIAHGLSPFYEDPYKNAASSLDEAVRNLCSVGADPTFISLLDNFSWGSPEDPETMGKLVRACDALYDVASIYRMPFISGKDSLYNEYESEGVKISVPPTILVSGIAVLEDINHTVTQRVKVPNNPIYIMGNTYLELGNSLLYRHFKLSGGEEPSLQPDNAIEMYRKLHLAIEKRLILSCHDCSEGGIGVAMSEMCFGTTMGMLIDPNCIPSSDTDDLRYTLFSESNSRFIVEVDGAKRVEFEDIMSGSIFTEIGQIIPKHELIIKGIVSIPIIRLERAWKSRKL